ncbi:carboxypeptidase-like regulatory domain-containing protein [Tunicatimonas pelagia]|uniref:carboxypeptidase-like regulatory domain-containing protein n=1 Tax=Tunicatimonas pelagia TaxID=931531 RepID=UPI0026668900|nr:carboxypeptidase-like regulatory domain-containing protein [Tunicatimonas pelagia]WKN45686.1 carboxypeptidase-like regulatory domain-containing protein [Tunicatimonas pelagia]
MKVIVTAFLFVSLFANTAFSQVVSGVVLDSATQQPLAYVHIGVLDKNMGVISRDDGTFKIDLSEAGSQDELTFSSVGYHTQHIPQSSWRSAPLKVYLSPRAFTLREVVVEDSRLSDPIKLGRYQPTKTTSGQSGLQNFGWGGEWGVRIFNDGQTYRVTDINFHTRFNTMDSVLFRINVYDVKNDLPDTSLLQQELFIKSYKRDKWITRDVTSRQLIVDQDIIVTFEVIQLWRSDTGNNALFFTHGKGYDRGEAYTRASSLAPWKKEGIPITLYLTAEGHLAE